MDQLYKQSWFLGELSDEVAAATLNNNGGMNTFAVYNNPEKNILTLAIRRPDGFEIRAITCEEGSYQITGQPDAHPDISTAVTRFAETQNLTPAFDGAVAAQLVSSTDVPPSYSQADRALQPEVAPLPPIEKESEALLIDEAQHSVSADDSVPHGPHTHYYRSLHLCHPKNVCHYCCYSDGEHWVYPNRKGPLRAAGVVIMWILLIIFCCPCALPIGIFLKLMHHVNFC